MYFLMRVDRGRDIGRLAVHCSVCGSVRIQFARTWRCMNWTLLQQMSEKTVYVLIPNLTENPIIESEKYKCPGMRASHPRRKKAGLTSKKRSVLRAKKQVGLTGRGQKRRHTNGWQMLHWHFYCSFSREAFFRWQMCWQIFWEGFST